MSARTPHAAALFAFATAIASAPKLHAAPGEGAARVAKVGETARVAKAEAGLARQERLARARTFFTEGEKKFQGGDFEGALADYRASLEVGRSPQALFGEASCLERLGSAGEAEASYRAFLAMPPPGSMQTEQQVAEGRVADLSRGELRVRSVPEGASVEIDGASASPSPLTVRLAPGKHTVRALAPGYEPVSREIELEANGAAELVVELKPAAPVPPEHTHVHSHSHAHAHSHGAEPTHPPLAYPTRGVAYGVLGAAAVGLGVGAFYGLRALDAKNDFDKNPSPSLADRQRDASVVADVALGSALMLGVTGAVFLSYASQRETVKAPAAASLRVVPSISPKSQGASIVLRF